MSVYLTDERSLLDLADTIRAKAGTSGLLTFPAGFAQAVSDLPSGGRENLLLTQGLTWSRGYLSASGNVQTQNATNLEATSSFIPLPADASKHLLLALELPVENAGSAWAAFFVYDANQAVLGSRKQFSFYDSVTVGSRKLVCAMADFTETGAAYLRVSFRTFGSAKAFLEAGNAPQEAVDLLGVTVTGA